MKLSSTLLALLPAALAAPISSTEDVVLDFSQVHKRQYTGVTTENQLTDGTPCREYTIIFARGTTEAGNVGSLTGPPFFQALANQVGASNVAVQGVAYAADVQGFLVGGDPTGSTTMKNLVVQAETQCPNTKVVMSGYSQGGQLVHNAAAQLTAAQAAKVSSGKVPFVEPF